LAAEHGRHLGLDAQRVGIDVGDCAAIFPVEPVAHPVDEIHHELLVDLGHGSPPRSPPPPAGGGPTALRTSTTRILCASCVKVWRTLQTKYLPEFRLPAPSICTIVPARSTLPRRPASVSPSQRANQPASRSSAWARSVSSPASSTGAVSITVIGFPVK